MIFLKFHRLVSSWILCQIDEMSTFYLYSYSVEKSKFLWNNSNRMLNRRNHLSCLRFKRYFIEKFHISLILIEFFFCLSCYSAEREAEIGIPRRQLPKGGTKEGPCPCCVGEISVDEAPKVAYRWIFSAAGRTSPAVRRRYVAPWVPLKYLTDTRISGNGFFPAQNISEPFASCLDDQWGGCWEVSGNISVPCVRLILF